MFQTFLQRLICVCHSFLTQGVITEIPTALEGCTKAAAAKRARGRQAESTKKGGGERESGGET